MNLYRNPADLDHWYMRVSKNVWLTFPARVNGGLERRPVWERDLSYLQPVPRWLAFHISRLRPRWTSSTDGETTGAHFPAGIRTNGEQRLGHSAPRPVVSA